MSDTRVRRPVVLLRPVPGTSVIHELWAGTKIVVVFCVSVVLAFYPGWGPIAVMAALLAVTVRLALSSICLIVGTQDRNLDGIDQFF
jgi:energy-coupling factor transport system permease protein